MPRLTCISHSFNGQCWHSTHQDSTTTTFIVTWAVPIRNSPKDRFFPLRFTTGPVNPSFNCTAVYPAEGNWIAFLQSVDNVCCAHPPADLLHHDNNLCPAKWCQPIVVFCRSRFVFQFSTLRFVAACMHLFLQIPCWPRQLWDLLFNFFDARIGCIFKFHFDELHVDG